MFKFIYKEIFYDFLFFFLQTNKSFTNTDLFQINFLISIFFNKYATPFTSYSTRPMAWSPYWFFGWWKKEKKWRISQYVWEEQTRILVVCCPKVYIYIIFKNRIFNSTNPFIWIRINRRFNTSRFSGQQCSQKFRNLVRDYHVNKNIYVE